MHIMALFALVILFTACKKGDDPVIDPTNDPSNEAPNPHNPGNTNKVPTELVGKWSYGTFSPTNFWDYNGQYAGNAYEQALVFDIHADGTYDEYIINSTTSYNCRTEAYTYFKGKISVDATNQTFVITPTSGKYRGFYSCAPRSNINRNATSSELKQEKMNYQVASGKTAIKLSDQENPQGVMLKAISW